MRALFCGKQLESHYLGMRACIVKPSEFYRYIQYYISRIVFVCHLQGSVLSSFAFGSPGTDGCAIVYRDQVPESLAIHSRHEICLCQLLVGPREELPYHRKLPTVADLTYMCAVDWPRHRIIRDAGRPYAHHAYVCAKLSRIVFIRGE